jgi:hypothetical protein
MWDVIIIIIIIIIHHGEINPYGCIVLGFMDTSKGVRKSKEGIPGVFTIHDDALFVARKCLFIKKRKGRKA